ncbi:hypothetical protein FA13DRAFT_1794984 [Coprinellus micaceus]|uniref:F-box domain-containing protein n=1 Tax=Coprinellus micaceus TaxID=71717 RepID=A0A4Y7SZ86_COPMI|nr:hypothetical protein FA13DRAFT_1794984 [Coprinellus micaceus]
MSGPSDPSKGPYLPDDIWLEIAAEAEPLDLLFLSQCCRSLYLLFSDKETWTKILRSVMHDCGPFIVEYSRRNDVEHSPTCRDRARKVEEAPSSESGSVEGSGGE